jgi:hypothetical protein
LTQHTSLANRIGAVACRTTGRHDCVLSYLPAFWTGCGERSDSEATRRLVILAPRTAGCRGRPRHIRASIWPAVRLSAKMTTVAASIPALVEPAVLRWARETIGLSEVAAARKLGLPDDRVAQWESGEAQPTIVQLRKAAEAYNRALGVFFLPAPPGRL